MRSLQIPICKYILEEYLGYSGFAQLIHSYLLENIRLEGPIIVFEGTFSNTYENMTYRSIFIFSFAAAMECVVGRNQDCDMVID